MNLSKKSTTGFKTRCASRRQENVRHVTYSECNRVRVELLSSNGASLHYLPPNPMKRLWRKVLCSFLLSFLQHVRLYRTRSHSPDAYDPDPLFHHGNLGITNTKCNITRSSRNIQQVHDLILLLLELIISLWTDFPSSKPYDLSTFDASYPTSIVHHIVLWSHTVEYASLCVCVRVSFSVGVSEWIERNLATWRPAVH